MPVGLRAFSAANGTWGCLIIKGKERSQERLKVQPVVRDLTEERGAGNMGPGASGNGVRTVTASRSVLGSGVSLHAYDIGVLAVYFVFVIGVGIWVSSPRGWSLAEEAGQALISGW